MVRVLPQDDARRRIRSLGWWRVALFIVVFGAFFAFEVRELFFAEQGVPESLRGRRPFLVDVAGATVVSQTFIVQAEGLFGVTLDAEPPARSDHDAMVELFDLGAIDETDDTPRLLFRKVERVTTLAAGGRCTITFPALEHGANRRYRLDLRVPNAKADEGLRLWASRDQAYPGGVLSVDGREQWADLVFRASAIRAVAFRDFEARLRGPVGPVAALVLPWGLFVLFNALLAGCVALMVTGIGSVRPGETASTAGG